MEDLWGWKFLRYGWEGLSDEERAEFEDDLRRAVGRGLVAEHGGEQAQRKCAGAPHPTRFVTKVTVVDPGTGGTVEVAIRKDLVPGAMVGLDASYLGQEIGPVYDPYNVGDRLDVPDDEEDCSQGSIDPTAAASHSRDAQTLVECIEALNGNVASLD